MKIETLLALREARQAGRPTALVTDLASGAQSLIVDGAAQPGELAVSDPVRVAAETAVQRDISCTVDDAGRRLFVGVFNPPRRIVVVGAVHIAQPLIAMAGPMGYELTLIDPRQAWATAERFPGVEIDRRWPAAALAEHAPDRRTAVVALTHDPKLDEPALAIALRSEAFYIGALGSRRTHARRLEHLREQGFGDEELSRIRGPVGLDIGAVSAAEIAVSILAEITQVLRARSS